MIEKIHPTARSKTISFVIWSVIFVALSYGTLIFSSEVRAIVILIIGVYCFFWGHTQVARAIDSSKKPNNH